MVSSEAKRDAPGRECDDVLVHGKGVVSHKSRTQRMRDLLTYYDAPESRSLTFFLSKTSDYEKGDTG